MDVRPGEARVNGAFAGTFANVATGALAARPLAARALATWSPARTVLVAIAVVVVAVTAHGAFNDPAENAANDAGDNARDVTPERDRENA